MNNITQLEYRPSREQADISAEDLSAIATDINNTPDDRGTIATREFGWLFTPGIPLQPLKPLAGELASLFMREGAFVSEPFSGTNAVAYVHNHNCGNVSPTITDVNGLLAAVEGNGRLKYSLIAATDSGRVGGFYELEYCGEQSQAGDFIKRNNELRTDRVEKNGPG
ncbi:hypothetical protein FJZ40_03115 [Candidatus Shapirobacteria bacterium]|nr:hypothetical protein [Candidatus Shapirobacteria bacterium]